MDYYSLLTQPYMGYVISVGSIILLVATVYYIWHLWTHEGPPHTQQIRHQISELSDSEVASDHMVVKAREVLEQSIDRAKHMLEQTDSFQHELEREARDMYTKSARRHESDFEEMVAGMREQYKQIFDKVATTAITEVGKMLTDQRLGVQEYLKERIDRELEQAKKEIQTYKESQIHQAGERVDALVNSIAKNVVSVSLSKAQQKELIYRALEQAAADGVFGDVSVEKPQQQVEANEASPQAVTKNDKPEPEQKEQEPQPTAAKQGALRA